MSHPRLIAALLAAGLAVFAFGAHAAESGHQHRFHDAQRWSKVFDDPRRDAWQKPHEVLEALALAPDAVVADLGAGTGYFTEKLAHRVPRGRVYAVDTEADMTAHLAQRARSAGLGNVRVVTAAPDDPRLPGKVDLVLLVDSYHHIADRTRYFSRLRAALEPGARVAVIDFRPDAPVGPPPQGRVAPEAVTEELKKAGYARIAQHDFLPYQYFLVFRPDGGL